MSETLERKPAVDDAENGAGAAPREEREVTRAFRMGYVALTAMAGLVSVLVSVLFQLAPGLRPDPGDNVGADVTVVALEPGTVRNWLRWGFQGEERARMLRKVGKDQLDYKGALLSVRLSVDGHKHDDIELRQYLYSARTHERVNVDAGFPLPTLDIEAPSQRSVRLMLLPDLSAEPDLFVRVELRDSDGLLAVANSPRIRDGRLPLE